MKITFTEPVSFWPCIAFCLRELRALVAPPPTAEPAIENWLDWFARASSNPADPRLQPSLDRVEQLTDERFWTADRLAQLNDFLPPFTLDAANGATAPVRNALRRLTDYFLLDSSFPRSEEPYPGLYELLYVGVLETAKYNESSSLILLRLAEARLRIDSRVKLDVCSNLHGWFSEVVPALENVILDALEMLAEYGVAPHVLLGWFRNWLAGLLAAPTRRERTSLQAWGSFAHWIQPGSDLLSRLDNLLQEAEPADRDDPLAALVPGYRIGIFTLRESSAARARDVLLERNSDLDVRICTATERNDMARSIARNSNMVVVVTSCLTHSLFYGISPYLPSKPVYPASSGSSGIVRAIEDAVRQPGSQPAPA